jgi:hypothetical protein
VICQETRRHMIPDETFIPDVILTSLKIGNEVPVPVGRFMGV